MAAMTPETAARRVQSWLDTQDAEDLAISDQVVSEFPPHSH